MNGESVCMSLSSLSKYLVASERGLEHILVLRTGSRHLPRSFSLAPSRKGSRCCFAQPRAPRGRHIEYYQVACRQWKSEVSPF